MFRGTILLVDNEPAILKSMPDFLEANGYQVHVAASPEGAKGLLSRQRVHLAVVDVRLRDHADDRDISGIVLAKEIDPLIPCIILTAFQHGTPPDVVVEALREDLSGRRPAVDFMFKPEGPQALLEAVKRAFEQHVGINFQLPVTVAEGCSLKDVAQRAFGERGLRRLRLSSAEVEEEIRELLQKLFREATSVEVSLRLPPGCEEEEEGAVLVRQTVEGRPPQRPMLVRFAPRGQVEDANRAELGWEPTGLNTEVEERAVTHHLGVVAYSFSRDFAAPDVLALTLRPGQHITIDFRGEETAPFETQTANPLRLNVERRKREAENARLSDDQHFAFKTLGQDLYNDIFASHLQVASGYGRAVRQEEADLHLVFKIERDLLSLPLEFLFWEPDWAVLRHPLSRFVLNANVRRQAFSPTFLRRCHRRREKLRILLVASNTPPDIPGCEREVETLTQLLPVFLRDNSIRYEITVLSTREATLARVREKLRGCPYHIFHYSGHGYYNHENPDESCLFFWDEDNGKRRAAKLTGRDLSLLTRGGRDQRTRLRFVYLSCCWAAAGAGGASLLDNDFLGLADALVQGGVPAVLGYRWPVSDDGAEELALAFYQSLFAQGHLATALLEARRHVIGGLGSDDTTWLSPILICQD